jgi:hypothetical protein
VIGRGWNRDGWYVDGAEVVMQRNDSRKACERNRKTSERNRKPAIEAGS